MRALFLTLLLFVTAPLAPVALAAEATVPKPLAGKTSQVRVVETAAGYQLLVNGQPFYVKGGGLEAGNQEALLAAGGNSFRTWRSDDGQAVLDRAQRNGLFVALGIDVARERHGFNYDDDKTVAAQLARVRSEVLQFKAHPALLMWVVGNELNLGAHNPRVWNAVNQIAQMIHQLDPDHPVMTTLAGFDPALIAELKSRAPALDLIGIQLYGDIAQLPEKLRDSHWTGPYLVTEWGPTGHWEIAKTDWGAPIEDDSSAKAANLVERYQRYIASDVRQCLGSYVFLWGNKQERTPTWYGLFLDSGEQTAGVDAMQYLWTGAWPGNRSPSITPIEIDGLRAVQSLHLRPGKSSEAVVRVTDADGDALAYQWQLREESGATSVGGDHEDLPQAVPVRMHDLGQGRLKFRAPAHSGAYRLFVTVRDGKGHAAHANYPFRVDLAP